MCSMKILLVEDTEQDRTSCQDAVKDLNEIDGPISIELIEAVNLEEALEKIDNTYDGAIIDLRLDEKDDGGDIVIKEIEKSCFKIPVIILTGTPDSVDMDNAIITVLKKGDAEAGYEDILKKFWGIYRTGMTRIMGARGTIEKTLATVFRQNILPQINQWVIYGNTDSLRTEKALLRHTLNHLLDLLDNDADCCFPEEFYLSPPLTKQIRTGSIVKDKDSEQRYVIMSPACDLVVREDGIFKTDRILIVEIENETKIVEESLDGINKQKKKKRLKSTFGNNYTKYYHWLPKTEFTEGGFMNFRKLFSISTDEYHDKFNEPKVQISSAFLKDIVSRFSAYYARQGQPDVDFSSIIETLV